MVETIYRHKKRGTTYRILHKAKFQYSASEEFDYSGTINFYLDDTGVVVYQDVDDPTKVWVRPWDQFFDGRFEEATDLMQKEAEIERECLAELN